MTDPLFDVKGKCIAITGGAGILFGSMARALAERGAKVAVIDYNLDGAAAICKEIEAGGGVAVPVKCNVLEKDNVEAACRETLQALGGIDVLINGAGGNKKDATCAHPTEFFDLPADAIRWVFDLNCLGTILPSQVFGKYFAQQDKGIIINTSSMAAFRPLTNVIGYAAAKAAISNFTQWLAVYMNQRHSKNIRVNAIAPGFFLTEQNRFLLTNQDGSMTPRGKLILDHTPMARYGEPDDLIGTMVWLISDAAKFVNGVVIPVDGGFAAFSGV